MKEVDLNLGLKRLRRYKGSMPNILNVIVKEALEFNRNNHRGFDKQLSNLCMCYALDGSRLLSIGYNKLKTHPFCQEYANNLHNSIHAEIDCLMKLNKTNRINYVTDLIIIRGTSNLCDSHPCFLCDKMIKMYFNKGVRLWYYKNKKWRMEII